MTSAPLPDALKPALEQLLVAPSSLWADGSDEPGLIGTGADLLYVQGRGDRLHALRLLDGVASLDGLDGLGDVGANWIWLVRVRPNVALDVAAKAAERVGAGLIDVDGGIARKVAQAPPRPGIFIGRWRELRSRWRQVSDW